MNKKKNLRELLGEDYEDFLAIRNVKWVGPYTVDELLDNCLDNAFPKNPECQSIYVVSKKSWDLRPFAEDCSPLYVGSTTGMVPRFRTRIGDLIADMFGFFQPQSGHHSGGMSLHGYCKQKNTNPKKLYIGWLENCQCVRCAEYFFWDLLSPELNVKRPPKCEEHNRYTI